MGLAGLAAIGASRPASRCVRAAARRGGHARRGTRAAPATRAGSSRSPRWSGILVAGRAARAVLRGRHGALPAGSRRVAGRALADGVAITVAATLATAPLLAHHFGSVPLAGLPANLLALPAVAPVMWLGMVKAALGQLRRCRAPRAPPRRSGAPRRRWPCATSAGWPSASPTLPARAAGADASGRRPRWSAAYAAARARPHPGGSRPPGALLGGTRHEAAARWRRLSRPAARRRARRWPCSRSRWRRGGRARAARARRSASRSASSTWARATPR